MSQWNRQPSGSKRRSEFTDPERLGSYRFPLSQQSNTSQSSEASTNSHSYQEGQIPKAVGTFSPLTPQPGISSDVVGTPIDVSLDTPSSKIRLPAPSATSSATFTLPPIAPTSPRPVSNTPHTGNLPPKFGTDYLTLQTLQRENTDLASAYTQAQSHLADLDTKFQASRAENGKLAKERQRLTGKIEFLEAQLDELEQSIQQTQEHTAAKDAQYSRIVELSTRLQNQFAAESQARKAEQHEWKFEKKSMQSVIDSLNNEVNGLRKVYASYARPRNVMPSPIEDNSDDVEGNPDLTAESSLHGPIAEMEALRRANARMEDALAGVQGDNAQLTECVEKLGTVEKNIQIHLRRVETARGTLDALGGKERTAKDLGLTKEADR